MILKLVRFHRPNWPIRAFVFALANCLFPDLFSQIKIGDNPGTLDTNAVLEIESTNKGLLLPRLSLSATTNASPLTAFVEGMFVFNTANINDISPGIYYSDGTKWIKVNSEGGAWSLSGNTGTNPSNDFIGTTDSVSVVFKTNNSERIRITEDGKVGIGTSTPSAELHVNGKVIIDSLSMGNLSTDNIIVVDPTDGKLRKVPSSKVIMDAQKRIEIVASPGQTIFTTPDVITDADKILLYRNGVLISFTVLNSNSIISEMPCSPGDEIRIFQLN